MQKAEQLKNELRREIEGDAEKILDRARREGERILEDTRLRTEQHKERIKQEIDQEQRLRRQRSLARAELEGRNALLEVRREEIDRVIEEVRKALDKMRRENSERYGELLWVLFAAGRSLLPGKMVRVRIGEDAEAVRQKLESEKKVEVVREEGLAGLIVESADGRLRCDFTLDNLLQRLRRERAAEIAALLFEEADEHQRR